MNKKNITKIDIGLLFLGMIVGSGLMTVLAVSGTDIVYDNTTSKLEATTVQEALDELYEKSENCSSGPSVLSLKVGDYVQMTPTKTSYTTDTSKTGYSSTQTINPSELNLWRIINVNSNGTYDAVSEYVSSTAVYFQGETGYKNLVGYLNTLASQYENNNYTIGSRYVGYNGQTQFMTSSLSTSTAGTSSTPALSGDAQEYNSGARGDTLYEKDYNLVNNALGTLIGKDVSDKSTAKNYWLASRYYDYNNSSSYYSWYGRNISTSGSLSCHRLCGYIIGWVDDSPSYSLRPIITLNSTIQGSGKGTSTDPYVLS